MTMEIRGNILLVEDEPDIARVIRLNLERDGFTVDWVKSGEDGLARIEEGGVDLLLLDIILPGIDGHEVCRRLRGDPRSHSLPVIMLTSMTEETDIVVGLGMGADDYVKKPFSGMELAARVKAALRRRNGADNIPPEKRTIKWESLHLNPVRHVVAIDGEPVPLTLAEFRLLHFLMVHHGRAFTRQELLPEVVGEGVYVIDRNIDVHIRNVRRKLGRYAPAIVTVRGVGYRFDGMDAEASSGLAGTG